MAFFSIKNLRHAYRMRYEPEEYTRAARSIWNIVLVCVSAALIASLAFGAWQFFLPPQTPVIEAKKGGITGFNREQLSTIVEFYGKRQATFETMMSGE